MGSPLATRAVVALLGAAMLTGCSSMRALFDTDDDSRTDGGPSGDETDTPIDAENLAYYLDYLNTLVRGDELDQAAAFNEAREAAELAPNRQNRLRYALALSVPGHAGSDAGEAAARLSDLLAADNLLTREERMLAEIQLESANAITILRETNRNTEQQLASARAAGNAEQARDLAGLEAENAALRAELENVQTMLDAITNIEQSLSEREDTDE